VSLYIKEGDYGRWAGCYVQVPGQPAKLFSYSRYGRSARREALAYRDALLRRVPASRVNGRWVKRAAQRNSRTGILGVHIQQHGRRKIVIAECGGQVRRRFSVEKYGLGQAIRLAKRARSQMVKAKLEQARTVRRH
jgi:hypothetical protein